MIKVTKDGRMIRTGVDYSRFRMEMYKRQKEKCWLCGGLTSITADLESDFSFHVHHEGGRGMGGSKRDDTFEKCHGLCGEHHRAEHNQ